MRINQPDADIAAETEEDDAAEIDIAGIAQHDVEVRGERDVDGGEHQALAHSYVVADGGQHHKSGDRKRNDPEERPPQHLKRSAPRREYAAGKRDQHQNE